MTKLQAILYSILFLLLSSGTAAVAAPKNSGYYQLKVYHYSNSQQETLIDNFLKNTFLPALHANKLTNIGVFKAIANDTATDKKLYVFIPFKSLKQWQNFLQSGISKQWESSAGEYVDAPYDKPAFSRIENIFMRAFPLSPSPSASKLTSPKSERVYELRSYESASEKIHVNKVQMFNEGGEIDIFSKLGFNAVFYGQVIFGAKMPNLIYMTSFENMNARNEHWKAFGSDPAWKTLSAMKEYQHNVSKNETSFLRATEYSDL
jgi:hypothetical protein